jgi:hypothetical protein
MKIRGVGFAVFNADRRTDKGDEASNNYRQLLHESAS